MGLFDYVEMPLTCPKCGHFEPAHNWQTKSLYCTLERYRPGDTVFDGYRTGRNGDLEIHTTCPKCDKAVVAFVLVENGKLTFKIEFPKVLVD